MSNRRFHYANSSLRSTYIFVLKRVILFSIFSSKCIIFLQNLHKQKDNEEYLRQHPELHDMMQACVQSVFSFFIYGVQKHILLHSSRFQFREFLSTNISKRCLKKNLKMCFITLRSSLRTTTSTGGSSKLRRKIASDNLGSFDFFIPLTSNIKVLYQLTNLVQYD